jgi:hypothetical protein|tara:strand:- start:709 stop:1311 length:603 start_codon:yes stop_codon:yes gene_type:complete
MEVIDNFFDNPYEIRNIALKCHSQTTDVTYPGVRKKVPTETASFTLKQIKKKFNKNFLISPHEVNGMAFDFIDRTFCAGMCHNDEVFSEKTFLVFLTPNPQPNSGIDIFDRINNQAEYTDIVETNKKKEKFLSSKRSFPQRFFYRREIDRLTKLQKNKISIENKFNRAVLFDSKRVHRAQNYFGLNKSNTRLTLVSFLWT